MAGYSSNDNSDLDALVRSIIAQSSPLPSIPLKIKSPITDAFTTLKANLELNSSFDQLIQQKHNAVRSVLENLGTSETKLIGSLQRRTRIQPRTRDAFDIDILVPLGEFTGWVSEGGITPQTAMDTLHNTLSQSSRYNAMAPVQDQPTVTFEHQNNVKIELVPAYKDNVGTSPDGTTHTPKGRGYWVPRGGRWVLAEYDHEADLITKHNTASGGWLVPLIKMLKAIKREHFPEMSSIHLETLAIHIMPGVFAMRKLLPEPLSYPKLITDFFGKIHPLYTQLVRMPGSNAAHLSLEGNAPVSVPLGIGVVQHTLINIRSTPTIAEKMKLWKALFGDPFPAY